MTAKILTGSTRDKSDGSPKLSKAKKLEKKEAEPGSAELKGTPEAEDP